MTRKTQRRIDYFSRLIGLIEKYKKIIIVKVDFVGSRQLAEIRLQLRGKAVLLMGKNTMIRAALRQLESIMPQLEALRNEVKLNVGFVFCAADPSQVREIILSNKLPAAAKEGAIAPVEVYVPAGLTGLDSNQTSFFQALNIATKVTKSQIEIISSSRLFAVGEKVSASAAALLQKLKIKPFSYGLEPLKIYDDGSVYGADVLEMTDQDVIKMFTTHLTNVAAFSREICFPTSASIVHSILQGFKNCAALCIESGDFDFPQMQQLRKFVEDPTAFASTGTTAAAAPTANAVQMTKAPEPVEEEPEEEDMGFSLFD